MIGSLLYLTISRPNITYVVGLCARYQSNPNVSHLTSVKRILKYVNGTSDCGLLYSSYTTVHWLGIVILTEQGTLRIGKELQMDVSFLGITCSPDLVTNRIVCPYLLLKPST